MYTTDNVVSAHGYHSPSKSNKMGGALATNGWRLCYETGTGILNDAQLHYSHSCNEVRKVRAHLRAPF